MKMKRIKYATPFIDLFRPLTTAEAKDLTASIQVQGVVNPVVVYNSPEHGLSILDGVNRWSISQELGIECPIDDRGDIDDDTAKELAEDLNMSRRHLSGADWLKMKAGREERIKRVAEKRAEGKSQSVIAAEEGISQSQVSADIKEAGNKGLLPEQPATVTGKDGKKQPAKKKPGSAKPGPKPKKSKEDDGGTETPTHLKEEPAKEEKQADPAADFVSELESVCRELDAIKARIEAWKGNPLAYTTHWQSHVANIESVRKSIWQGIPRHVCPYCDGKKCDACKKTGRVQKSTYKAGLEATGKAA